MKGLKYLFWVCCFLPVLTGCGGKATKATLHFDIRDYDGTEPVVVIGSLTMTLPVDSLTGMGTVEIELQRPAFATLHIRKNSTKLLYLEPGKDLTVSYGMKQGEIMFDGELAAENRFLHTKDAYVFLPSDPTQTDIKVVAARLDSVERINAQRLKDRSFPPAFMEMESKRLTVNSLLRLVGTRVVDTEKYLEVMRDRFIEGPEYLAIPEYLKYLDQYIIRRLPLLTGDKNLSEVDRKLASITENVTDPDVLAYLIDAVLFGAGETAQQKYRDIYYRYVTDPQRREAFAEACKVFDRMMPGNPCPDFTFADVNDGRVSLSDLSGKYVYLDIWATWCGPCKGEVPSLLELEEKLAGRDITFVGLSVDKNADIVKWKQDVADLKLKGIQLHLGEDWGWLKNFMPGGISIPRFILLDREGKIVDAHMSRPSDKGTLERLESLLN